MQRQTTNEETNELLLSHKQTNNKIDISHSLNTRAYRGNVGRRKAGRQEGRKEREREREREREIQQAVHARHTTANCRKAACRDTLILTN